MITQTTIHIDENLRKEGKKLAIDNDKTFSEMVSLLIEKQIIKQNGNPTTR